MLLVTGGQTNTDTTEVMDYASGGPWRYAGALPSARQGLTGSSIDGVLFVSGGHDGSYQNAILQWDPVSETWKSAGNIATARYRHGMATVPQSAVAHHCPGYPVLLHTSDAYKYYKVKVFRIQK